MKRPCWISEMVMAMDRPWTLTSTVAPSSPASRPVGMNTTVPGHHEPYRSRSRSAGKIASVGALTTTLASAYSALRLRRFSPSRTASRGVPIASRSSPSVSQAGNSSRSSARIWRSSSSPILSSSPGGGRAMSRGSCASRASSTRCSPISLSRSGRISGARVRTNGKSASSSAAKCGARSSSANRSTRRTWWTGSCVHPSDNSALGPWRSLRASASPW